MPKLAEKKQLKRERILDCAFKLFVSKSVNSTAVDDVVRMAGIAKGTFYLYFKDKYDLLNQIVVYKSAGVLERAIDNLARERETREMTFAQQTLCVVDYIIDYLSLHRELASLINKDFSACLNAVMGKENEELSRAVNSLTRLYMDRGYSAEDARKTIYIIMDLTGSVCCGAILNRSPYSLEEIKPFLHSTIEKLLE